MYVISKCRLLEVIDDEKFKELAESNKMKPEELLEADNMMEKLPPCYTFVKITRENDIYNPEIRAWYMREDGIGEIIDVCDQRCSKVGKECN